MKRSLDRRTTLVRARKFKVYLCAAVLRAHRVVRRSVQMLKITQRFGERRLTDRRSDDFGRGRDALPAFF
jgi:hypothetical protein